MAFVGDCMQMVGRLLTFPIPVASLVNGHAFGLGAMITLASDYKVMREDRGYFRLPEVDLGMTLTERMNALVCGKLSGKVLRDVLLTGKRVGGPEAASCRIVDASGALADLETLFRDHLCQPLSRFVDRSADCIKQGRHIRRGFAQPLLQHFMIMFPPMRRRPPDATLCPGEPIR